MQARDIMTAPVHTILDTATVGEAVQLLAENKISAVPVVNAEGKPVGILTHTDFFFHPIHYPGAEGHLFEVLGSLVGLENLEKVSHELGQRIVGDVMSRPVVTIQEDTDIAEIVRLMLHDKRKRLPVVRGDRVVGIVCRHDFLKLMMPAEAPPEAPRS